MCMAPQIHPFVLANHFCYTLTGLYVNLFKLLGKSALFGYSWPAPTLFSESPHSSGQMDNVVGSLVM